MQAGYRAAKSVLQSADAVFIAEGHIARGALASCGRTLRSPETPSMYGTSMRENRETPALLGSTAGRSAKT